MQTKSWQSFTQIKGIVMQTKSWRSLTETKGIVMQTKSWRSFTQTKGIVMQTEVINKPWVYSSTMRLSTLCGLHRDTEQ